MNRILTNLPMGQISEKSIDYFLTTSICQKLIDYFFKTSIHNFFEKPNKGEGTGHKTLHLWISLEI